MTNNSETGLTLSILASELGAALVVPSGQDAAVVGNQKIQGVAPIEHAGPNQVTFLTNPEYARHLAQSRAAAVIIREPASDCRVPQLVHANPYYAFALTAQKFLKPVRDISGINPKAHVDPSAKVAADVTLGPFVFVGAKAVIGAGTIIQAGAYIGPEAQIGEGCDIRANVVIEYRCIIGNRVLIHGGAVIGADGFGFAPGVNDIAKIPQIGIVRIADDVEIGPLCTIDRAAMGETVIGRGTKLDSQVHIGHNVQIGEHCMICGQAGMAGSARLGNWITIAGQSGINSHIKICDHVTLGAMSAFVSDVEEKGTYMGFPAEPATAWRRQLASVRRLPMLEKRLRDLEAALAKLSGDT